MSSLSARSESLASRMFKFERVICDFMRSGRKENNGMKAKRLGSVEAKAIFLLLRSGPHLFQLRGSGYISSLSFR
jgi:hypothetical protein